MSELTREFTPVTVETILWSQQECARRTPLHVEFSHKSNMVEAVAIPGVEFADFDPELFNAVGSAVIGSDFSMHLPVIDADGGAEVWQGRDGYWKLALHADFRFQGRHGHKSELRALLADHAIGLEVFERPLPRMIPRTFRGRQVTPRPDADYTNMENLGVRTLVFSAPGRIFRTVASTDPKHSHVFVQQLFEDGDHKLLIRELQDHGIVSRAWVEMTKLEKQGVLRTPWTDKEPDHSTT